MTELVANYKAARQAFNSLLERDCRRRILLLSGDEGFGKTWLISQCSSAMPTHVKHVPVKLRPDDKLSELLRRLCHGIGRDRFPRFAARANGLDGALKVEINIRGNWIFGLWNTISAILNTGDLEKLQNLTEAWFEDLADIPDIILLLFDNFEDAPPDICAWIKGPMLARAAKSPGVRIVISGRPKSLPEPRDNVEWVDCSVLQRLDGVAEATHWMPVIRSLGRRIDTDDPERTLAIYCQALKGSPRAIMNLIDGLPEGPPA